MDAWMPALVLGAMMFIFIGSYVLNKRTPVPPQALTEAEEAACKACNIVSCSRHGGGDD